VEKCILFVTYNTYTYKQINLGGLANESIFAIILQTFDELTNINANAVINQSSNICDWSRMSSATSPYVFKEATRENIYIINKLLKENPYAMFLRKVDCDFPDTVIRQFMDADTIS
jgi:hypothetical protein